MNLFPWKERQLKTVWRVEKDGRASFLVGTAHFSPYSFRKILTRLVRDADIILFEGPLDPESMAEVARYGCRGEDTPSLYDALDPALVREINRCLCPPSAPGTTAGSYLDLLCSQPSGFMETRARGVRPWMAFFTAWTTFLNWKHSMDVEAFQIALKLGKRIEFLETIRDQLTALDGIPFERIVRYFNQFHSWSAHRERFSRVFLEGKMQDYLSVTGDFPTRCESIIGRRDPIFFAGIRAACEEGKTTAFVGLGHTPGVRQLLADVGYRVTQEEPC